MPTSVIDLDVSASTGAVAQPTYNDIVVFGSSTAAPSAGFDNPERYSTVEAVAGDFGTEVPALETASEALVQMGVQEWSVICAERTAVDAEDPGQSGTLQNSPIYGDESTISAQVDGSDVTPVPKAVSPPDANTSPQTGEVFYNAETGEVEFGDGGGTSYSFSYEYVDWGGSKPSASAIGADLLGAADYNFGRAGIGDLSELAGFASANNMGMVAMLKNGYDYSTEDEALTAAHATAGYVPNGDLLMIAHKSGADVASHVLGQLGTNRPWFDPFWDGDSYPFASDYYDRALVGDPATGGSFEGGDNANQEGPVNVVINVEGTQVLSNSLTTAGQSSNYRYFDVGRTEAFISAEIERLLEGLRLRIDKIPYTANGRSQILGELRGGLKQYARGSNAPLSSISINAPKVNQISDSDKANRVFPGITVNGTLAGNVHDFGVELNIKV